MSLECQYHNIREQHDRMVVYTAKHALFLCIFDDNVDVLYRQERDVDVAHVSEKKMNVACTVSEPIFPSRQRKFACCHG